MRKQVADFELGREMMTIDRIMYIPQYQDVIFLAADSSVTDFIDVGLNIRLRDPIEADG